MKVFGCLGYVTQRKVDKFSLMAIPTVFLGYSTTQKGYIMYDFHSKVFLMSRDVLFLEDTFLFKTASLSTSHLFPLQDTNISSTPMKNVISSCDIPPIEVTHVSPHTNLVVVIDPSDIVSPPPFPTAPTIAIEAKRSSRQIKPSIWMSDYISKGQATVNCCYILYQRWLAMIMCLLHLLLPWHFILPLRDSLPT